MEEDDEETAGEEIVELPIIGVLDLHSFRPSEVSAVVRDYLDAACEKGLRDLRIIHGKGVGVQRQTVRTLLGRDPLVEAFGDAETWGATWVRMKPSPPAPLPAAHPDPRERGD